MSKRGHGEGSITERSKGKWRVRYRFNGKRHSEEVIGSRDDARRALVARLSAKDEGELVAPDRLTVGQWIEHWLKIGAPGRRGKVGTLRTIERYAQLLNTHVVPTLSDVRIQKVKATEIERLYASKKDAMAPTTLHHVHAVFSACLSAAVRAKKLTTSPMAELLSTPSAGTENHGIALDEAELKRLVDGFRTSSLFPIVAVAAYTGMRRNEILALRWSDFDAASRVIHVRRAIEQTKAGRSFKPPKTKRGVRDIVVDEGLTALLVARKETFLRLVAGVSDDTGVNLSLVKLKADTLIFPAPSAGPVDLARPRDPDAITRGFVRRARLLGFSGLRFHDLRGSHATQLLRRGMPVDVVARRLGHDPYTLLRSYAKAIGTDHAAVAEQLKGMSAL